MPLTIDDSGRRVSRPSGSSLPSDLSRLIAQRWSTSGTGGAGGPGGTYLTIDLGGTSTRPLHVDREGGIHGTITTRNQRTFSTIDEAVNSWYLLQDAYRDELQRKMWFLGLIDGPNNMAQASRVWAAAVEESWKFKAAGRDISPVNMLRRMTNLRAGQLGPDGSLKPRVTTQRQINFTDPAQARAWIRQAFQESMGRDPHDAEIRAMLRAIVEGNRKHPQVTKTTTDPDGNVTQQVIDPGFDPTAYIANRLADDPEARASQAAATYYPALIEAISSPI